MSSGTSQRIAAFGVAALAVLAAVVVTNLIRAPAPDSASVATPSSAIASPPVTATPTTSPTSSPTPPPSGRPAGGIEGYPLGPLRGEYAFVLNGGATTTAGAVAEVWAVPLSGGEARLAVRYVNAKSPSTNTGANVLARQLSPDGRRLLLSAAATGASGERLVIFVVDLETGRVQPVGAEDGADHEKPAWSPDGRRIA